MGIGHQYLKSEQRQFESREITMAKVSVIGSGMMGSALTRALLKGGHDVMVFDLDVTKSEPLAALGASVAKNSQELAEHADFLIPSLPSYRGLEGFVKSEGVIAALQGTVIVQLSSGSPEMVQAFGELIANAGVGYLEGRIKNYPEDVGKPGSKIICSGDERLFAKAEPVLEALAEHVDYVSDQLEAVAALDEAVVTASYGQIWAMMLAGKLCQKYGVSPMVLLELTKETSLLNMADLEETGYPDLVSGNFRDDLDTATMTVWADSGEMTLEAIDAAGLDTTVFSAIQDLLRKAEKAGLANRGIHAIADVMAK
ncbi:NAD(P)-dependent oxidoreductase [Mycobacterium sp. CBMA360]|uniref:NAD(P)-dependent oxidoreductase n=1 Tax=Mycolicibacterium sp. CBMA 360 TaxID=2606614 RepID=UPI0012DE1BA1|nr:NAD(P)-binding domain-containing protein [Mycolicibacterium sp. CBMA 360]MUL49875.1 NAD(P)-dependent oxidoreductase [Mycolicibacterium sp. CBMA 360]